ncbi:MAG: DUF5667 domain-containing protein [Dehalococcoidia bacterium]
MSEFETRLQACIEALREGRWTLDECLARNLEYAAELRPYLLTAIALREAYVAAPREEFAREARERYLIASGQRVAEAFSVQPREEFARAARERFLIATGQRLAEAYDMEPSPSFFATARVHLLMAAHRMRQEAAGAPKRAIPFVGAHFRVLASAAAALVLMLSFSTYTVASASSALPGDWRYPIKLETERVRLTLALSEGAKRDVRLNIASERGEEIQKLAAKGRIIGPGVLDRLVDSTEPLVNDVDPDWDTEDIAKLQAIASRQRVLLRAVAPQIAPDARPQLEAAANLSQRGVTASADAIRQQPDLPPAVITPNVPVTLTPAADATETPEATPTSDGTPSAGVTPAGSPTAVRTPDLSVDPDPVDSSLGVIWNRLAVGRMTALIPSEADGWRIAGINVASGPVVAPTLVRIVNADGTSIITINPRNGDMYWFVERERRFDEVQLRLTTNGQTLVVDRDMLRALYGEKANIALFILDSIVLEPEPEPTPEPTSTPEAAP